jgi:hypothetical protein
LNKDFRRLNSDANNTWPQAADVQVEFCLASIDPAGNSTSGITRTPTSTTAFGTNDQMKFTSSGGKDAWPTASYLNIWVCDISGGILGYAQFPGGSATTDGVVVDYQYFGTTGTATAPFNLGRTATHEVGHWLNLRHIWGDGGCTVDDFVNDTPVSDAPNFGCATGHVSCGTVDMVQNYMDYSDDACMNLFSAGQKTRMQALFAPGGFRAGLLNSPGCGGTPATCTDGVQNGQETGVDCGGPTCPACVCNNNLVTVSIKLDNYPEETSWSISGTQGVVASGGTYGSLADGSTVSVPLCLVDGCYNFTINDAYGDGICCSYGQGSYNVTNSAGVVLVSGATFGASETKSFCLTTAPAGTCTDGVQNQGETGVDCGGPCAACATCTDGVQNQGETGVDCGGPCAACATCTDGVQNQGETGVDCGGPCAACACVETLINFNNFDASWGIWVDGGTDCARSSRFAAYANSGSFCVRLRDNTNTSVMSTTNLNLAGFTKVTVAFSYVCVSMDNSNEDFWLQVSTNGGASYTTVATWRLNTEFVNNVRYNPTVNLTGTFTSNTRFRFRCDASDDDDLVYIDDVRITGCSNAGGRTEDIFATDPTVIQPKLTDFVVYPNPATNLLTVQFTANQEMETNLRIMDVTGKVLQTETLPTNLGTLEHTLDISALAPGIYFISVESAKDRLIQRIVVVE